MNYEMKLTVLVWEGNGHDDCERCWRSTSSTDRPDSRVALSKMRGNLSVRPQMFSEGKRK